MNLTCFYCQTPFTLSMEQKIAALRKMHAENLHHYDAHCPRCGRANAISRERLEMFTPGWEEAIKAPAAESGAPVRPAMPPAPAPSSSMPSSSMGTGMGSSPAPAMKKAAAPTRRRHAPAAKKAARKATAKRKPAKKAPARKKAVKKSAKAKTKSAARKKTRAAAKKSRKR
jgi:hypothetical protein